MRADLRSIGWNAHVRRRPKSGLQFAAVSRDRRIIAARRLPPAGRDIPINSSPRILLYGALALGLAVIGAIAIVGKFSGAGPATRPPQTAHAPADQLAQSAATQESGRYQPRRLFDVGGYFPEQIKPWQTDATLADVSRTWEQSAVDAVREIEQVYRSGSLEGGEATRIGVMRAACLNFEGKPAEALQVLSDLRVKIADDALEAASNLYSLIFYQGVTSLRLGETENCVLCRGESSCILPISKAARHANETGSRLAIGYFSEYLKQFPDDLEVKWLLNVAHMTLGEHPGEVDPRHLISLERYQSSEFDIGKFRDVGSLVGLDRLNRQGGGLMEDFDNDGLLDIATTVNAPNEPMGFYRNRGDGSFADQTQAAGLQGQMTGLYCVQTDYNNDGFMDIFVPRGAWVPSPVRPSLLRNNGNGSFSDVTAEAGLATPTCSLTACWADYDNDGNLDLFLPDKQDRLYRNRGDGKFAEVSLEERPAATSEERFSWKSGNWLDYDNDRYPDLYVNSLFGTAVLYHNNRDGSFSDATAEMGVAGHKMGFACWSWDYDNDGWLDLFTTSYDPRSRVTEVVRGLLGQQHHSHPNKLYRNLGGKRFEDVTKEVGLDMMFTTMGCNFADFDNDGYLDFYLGTGDPYLSTLVPNRMFRNVEGKRFADISASSGTGHLQKGHSVACGDWDRNGTLDIFIQMGGVTPVDRFHNLLFQNPGQGNNWLNLKLHGAKSNRAALGARIKLVTAGENPQTIYRHVTSGSSFGANPLEQMVGLGKAERVDLLEIEWPTSGETQVFRNLPANQYLEITESADEVKPRQFTRVVVPEAK
jgi:hypothetical protein